ncbi:hypothetical protein BD311DRAFT_869107 [Dichomitus squalens]|uniref:Uncharacterized protein n=1 Tax=Dichomitus squalens TaxID=114155 RepID=A0A4Q9M972_9APHY|nr:hypothetical protein BD311DRAFT_869107 [Dichomitus squalens]
MKLTRNVDRGTQGLIGDFITLFSWRLCSDPPSEKCPYGYGKSDILGKAVPSIVGEHVHVHSHDREGRGDGLLDPNAAWLYRCAIRVADEERSPILLVNAVHESDVFGSAVALVAILGH